LRSLDNDRLDPKCQQAFDQRFSLPSPPGRELILKNVKHGGFDHPKWGISTRRNDGFNMGKNMGLSIQSWHLQMIFE
jgi:hypothetical protein